MINQNTTHRSARVLSPFLLALLAFGALPANAQKPVKQQERLGSSSSPAQIAPKTQSIETTSADPAYAAFQKGQYLKALKLATAQSKKGEPQAFTLIGAHICRRSGR